MLLCGDQAFVLMPVQVLMLISINCPLTGTSPGKILATQRALEAAGQRAGVLCEMIRKRACYTDPAKLKLGGKLQTVREGGSQDGEGPILFNPVARLA
jgi:hypothetical protein